MMPTLPFLSSSYAMLQHVEKQNEIFPPIPRFSNDSAAFNSVSQNTSVGRGYIQRFHFDSKRNPSLLIPEEIKLMAEYLPPLILVL